MSVSKRVVLAVGCSLVIGLFTAAMAQTTGDKNKSTEAAAIGEGEAIMVHPKGAVHKSNLKVSAAKHEAAMKKGAREITSGTVLYRQGGKLYMMEEASEHFQDHFDQPYQGGPKSN
jgi:hypothetical protein